MMLILRTNLELDTNLESTLNISKINYWDNASVDKVTYFLNESLKWLYMQFETEITK